MASQKYETGAVLRLGAAICSSAWRETDVIKKEGFRKVLWISIMFKFLTVLIASVLSMNVAHASSCSSVSNDLSGALTNGGMYLNVGTSGIVSANWFTNGNSESCVTTGFVLPFTIASDSNWDFTVTPQNDNAYFDVKLDGFSVGDSMSDQISTGSDYWEQVLSGGTHTLALIEYAPSPTNPQIFVPTADQLVTVSADLLNFVPEPLSLSYLAFGVATLAFKRRRNGGA